MIQAQTEKQTEKGELTKDKTISDKISAGEMHQYSVSMKENEYGFFKLMQNGVDLKVVTYDSKGEEIEKFDSPNGKFGPELFTILSGKKGDYQILVQPYDENEPLGEYDLSIVVLKPQATTKPEMVDQVFTAWDNNDSPGASVAVMQNGKIIYKNAYGMANLEYDIPITENSIFHVASISKQFSVFSILLLESEGKLSIDDDVRKYIPELPDFGHKITLHHLAAHTSGLRDQWTLLVMAGVRHDDVITKEHILKLLSNQKELNFNPGEEFEYCNSGFTLLAEIVARISGKTFAEFTEERIFKPLNMTNSQFFDDHEKIVKNRAYSYQSSGEGFKKKVLSFANVGATSLFTTAEDLLKWSANYKNLTIGSAKIVEKMNSPSTLNDGTKIEHALGQFVMKYKGLNEIQHGGADAGYRAYLTRFPDHDFSVAVLSNAAGFNPVNTAHKVVDVYLKEHFIEEKPKEELAEGGFEINNAAVVEKFDKDAVKLESFIGNYYSEELLTFYEVKMKDGKLVIEHWRNSDTALTPIAEDSFRGIQSILRDVNFFRDPEGAIVSMKISSGRTRNVEFRKMD